MKKLTALLIAIVITALALVSCGGGGDNKETAGSDKISDEKYHADYLPDKNYGYKIRSMSINDAPNINISIDADTPNKLSVARYNAINRICEKYGFSIEESYRLSWEELSENVTMLYASQSDDFDFNMLIHREAWKFGINGYLADWDSLPYCDETQPWYVQYFNEAQQVLGTNVINYTWAASNLYQSTVAVIFNESMVEDLQLDNPYDLVNSNEWDLDAMIRLAEEATSDLDNDGEIDDTDRVGISGRNDNVVPSLWMGAGYRLIDKDSEGMPVFVASKSEGFIDILDRITDLMNARTLYSTTKFGTVQYGSDQEEGEMGMLRGGNSLFSVKSINTFTKLADVQYNYGIVPLPKRNEAQENYISRCCDVWCNECVPATCQHLEEISVFIEAFAVESLNHCFDAYYHDVLQDRYSDERARKMLDIIISNVSVDLGDTIWQSNCRNHIINWVQAGTKGFASGFEQINVLVDATIERDIGLLQEVIESRNSAKTK